MQGTEVLPQMRSVRYGPRPFVAYAGSAQLQNAGLVTSVLPQMHFVRCLLHAGSEAAAAAAAAAAARAAQAAETQAAAAAMGQASCLGALMRSQVSTRGLISIPSLFINVFLTP
eukprot:1162001-Pelagomonas_calceolata.AAC.2